MINRWFGLRLAKGQGPGKFLELDEVLSQTGFDDGLANPLEETSLEEVFPDLVPYGVRLAQKQMERLRQNRGQALGNQLRQDLRDLKKWYDASMKSIAEREYAAKGAQKAKLYHEKQEVRALFEQRRRWLDDSFKTVPQAYLRLAAIFVGS